MTAIQTAVTGTSNEPSLTEVADVLDQLVDLVLYEIRNPGHINWPQVVADLHAESYEENAYMGEAYDATNGVIAGSWLIGNLLSVALLPGMPRNVIFGNFVGAVSEWHGAYD